MINCKKIFYCALIFATLPSFSMVSKNKATNYFDVEKEGNVIDLRDEVMHQYYDNLLDTTKATLDFDSFDSGYYKSKMPIKDYTDAVDYLALTNPNMLTLDFSGIDFGFIKKKGGEDADYIISNFRKKNGSYPSSNLPIYNSYEKTIEYDADNENHPRCFSIQDGYNPRKPNYNGNYEYYKTRIRPGDIVWDTISYEDIDKWDAVTHTGIVVNTEKKGYFQTSSTTTDDFYFIETIEAVGSGVRFGFLDDDRVLSYGTRVLSLRTVNDYQIEQTISFAFKQLGKPYELDVLKTAYNIPDENSSKWYCNELVFCAYYWAGISIDAVDIDGENAIVYQGNKIRGPIFGDYLYCSPITYIVDFFQYENFVEFNVNHDEDATTLIKNTLGRPAVVTYATSKQDWNTAIKSYGSLTCKKIGLGNYEEAYVSSSGTLNNKTFVCYVIDGSYVYISLLRRSCGAFLIPIYLRKSKGDDLKYEYQLGQKNDGSYVLQINNRNGSKTLKTPSCFLSSSQINNWDIPTGCTVTDRSIGGYKTSSFILSITNNTNNRFPVAEYAANSNCRTIVFEVDKSNYKNTVSETTISSSYFTPKVGVYLSVSIVKKSGSTWTIRVYNSASYSQTFYYNKKMCFQNDAKVFSKSGLGNNISSKQTIAGFGSAEITISENLFADYITVCVVDRQETYKYVTYAKNLNASKKTMTIYNNKVSNNGHLTA